MWADFFLLGASVLCPERALRQGRSDLFQAAAPLGAVPRQCARPGLTGHNPWRNQKG